MFLKTKRFGEFDRCKGKTYAVVLPPYYGSQSLRDKVRVVASSQHFYSKVGALNPEPRGVIRNV